MEKPKNLYARHELRGGIAGGIAEYWVDRGKGRKIGATVIPYSIKCILKKKRKKPNLIVVLHRTLKKAQYLKASPRAIYILCGYYIKEHIGPLVWLILH